MIIVMEPSSSEEQVQKVIETLVEAGYDVHRSTGVQHTILGAVGSPKRVLDSMTLEIFEGVREVVMVSAPYKLASRTFRREDTVVDVAGVPVGGPEVVVMAGPCSVESKPQVAAVARAVQASGARMLRGGAFKPRTSPYAFQGHGEPALRWMREVGDEMGLAIVTEIMDPRQVEMFLRYVDCFQVGARNCQNFDLLKELGKIRRPVLLKRGPSTTIEEWLLSAEYTRALRRRGASPPRGRCDVVRGGVARQTQWAPRHTKPKTRPRGTAKAAAALEREWARCCQQEREQGAAREPRGEIGEKPTAVLENGVHGSVLDLDTAHERESGEDELLRSSRLGVGLVVDSSQ